MKHKLTALNQPRAAVIKNDHLKIIVQDGELILTFKTMDGVGITKAWGQFVKQVGDGAIDITHCHKANITCVHEADISFLDMYLAATPGLPPGKWFGAALEPGQRKIIHFNLIGTAAANQIYNLLGTSVNGKIGILQTAIPFFSANTDATFTLHLKQDDLQAFQSRLEQPKTLYQRLAQRLGEHLPFRNEDERINREIAAFFKAHVTLKPILSHRPNLPAHYEDWLEALQAGKTLHTVSDETTQGFLSGKDLYLVDVGNPATADMVEHFISQKAVNHIYILLTHGHQDHTAGLKELLQLAANKKTPVHLLFPLTSQYQQLDAWYRTNAVDLEPVLDTGLTEIIDLENLQGPADQPIRYYSYLEQRAGQPYYSAKPTLPGVLFNMAEAKTAIPHFIFSKGFTLQCGTKARLFTGDINPQNPKQTVGELEAGLKEYLTVLMKPALENNAIADIDIFMDFGHFLAHPGHPEVQAWLRDFAAAAAPGRQVRIFFDHMKNDDGVIIQPD